MRKSKYERNELNRMKTLFSRYVNLESKKSNKTKVNNDLIEVKAETTCLPHFHLNFLFSHAFSRFIFGKAV